MGMKMVNFSGGQLKKYEWYWEEYICTKHLNNYN